MYSIFIGRRELHSCLNSSRLPWRNRPCRLPPRRGRACDVLFVHRRQQRSSSPDWAAPSCVGLFLSRVYLSIYLSIFLSPSLVPALSSTSAASPVWSWPAPTASPCSTWPPPPARPPRVAGHRRPRRQLLRAPGPAAACGGRGHRQRTEAALIAAFDAFDFEAIFEHILGGAAHRGAGGSGGMDLLVAKRVRGAP